MDFSDSKIWDGIRLVRSVAKDSAATADQSVPGTFNREELEDTIQWAASQPTDSNTDTRGKSTFVDVHDVGIEFLEAGVDGGR